MSLNSKEAWKEYEEAHIAYQASVHIQDAERLTDDSEKGRKWNKSVVRLLELERAARSRYVLASLREKAVVGKDFEAERSAVLRDSYLCVRSGAAANWAALALVLLFYLVWIMGHR